MSEKAVHEEQEGPGLDELMEQYKEEQTEAERLENQPDKAEIEQARKLAEKMNSSFLWVVNRTQCPHVAINELVEKEQGDEAFLGLAEKWGGEMPPWLEALQPYIAAGVYMGVTISTARAAESQVIAAARAEQAKQQQGADNGEKPGS
jgi:hypothetical protein